MRSMYMQLPLNANETWHLSPFTSDQPSVVGLVLSFYPAFRLNVSSTYLLSFIHPHTWVKIHMLTEDTPWQVFNWVSDLSYVLKSFVFSNRED